VTFERIGANELIDRHLPRLKGRVLELGAGPDAYLEVDGTQVISLDIDRQFAPTVTADAHALPFADASFDGVIASQVFEHLHDPSVAAGELARVMRPGACLILAVPFLYWVHQEPHDYYRYTAYGLRQIFEGPFEIEHLDGYGTRFTVALDVALTRTETSSTARRALRKFRKSIRPVDPKRRHPRIGRALVRWHRGEFPHGFVLAARRA
jgi:SAM-dependent methyltransferase